MLVVKLIKMYVHSMYFWWSISTKENKKYASEWHLRILYCHINCFFAPWEKLILNKNQIIALFQNLYCRPGVFVFFFLHETNTSLWTPAFSIEECVIQLKILIGKVKQTNKQTYLHTSITAIITIPWYVGFEFLYDI